ncbi:MAG: DUF4032 domain-containing protein [Propionibacteriaceae bacterium]|jgi:hypothetical protein|nr:DUF4032 domain-containing protein [Propionibacteriaceae bacterium]
MPRFVSTTPDSRLLPFPWDTPLADWPVELLVALPRGLSRHVVRFIQVGHSVYAAKEVVEHLAVHEYRLLTDLYRLDTPSVEPVGIITERRDRAGNLLDPILLTRHLEFSLPYRSLFTPGVRQETVSRLLDAMVVLIARLHLIGFKWGDVSLSNILFRRDAGDFAAYLVDAETGELHTGLSDGQREQDLEIARTNLYGDFLDLQAGGLLLPPLDPITLVDTVTTRYHELWQELTGVEEFSGSEMDRIEGRVRRLNALGFDVAEMDIQTDAGSSKIRIQPKVVDAGHHQRRLMRLTGLDTEENQARRLLNDLDTYRFRMGLSHVDEAVVAHRWLTEVFEPVMQQVPQQLRAKREPAQLFHEVLDYRWYGSQREHREMPMIEAAQGYVRDVLEALPDEAMSREALLPVGPTERLVNPYDPSQGYVEEGEQPPHDPWEDEVDDSPVPSGFLDIAALRAKAADTGEGSGATR